MSRCLLATSALALAFAASAHAADVTVTSPDGRTQVVVGHDNGLTFKVTRDGKALIDPSQLGLNTDAGNFGHGDIAVDAQKDTMVDTTYDMVVGKASKVADHYNQTELDLSDGKLKLDLIVRAYDNGVALRYVLPPQNAFKDFKLYGEMTRFNFSADYDCWGINEGRFLNSHEGEFDKIKASSIRNFHLYDAPLVCKTGHGDETFAIAEADVNHYPTAWLAGRGDGGVGVEVFLTPRTDNDPGARQVQIAADLSMSPDGIKTPWRVMMIGDHPGDLTASTLIPQLAAPSQIADTSWIKSGKTAWDWWNDWAVDVPHPGINTESYKAYTDFAASMNAQYILIDEGWSVGSSTEANPNADLTKSIPAMDMPAIVAYAKSKGIGVWVWAQWQQLDGQMDAALSQYEAWGLKGVKVDFINRSDQEAVDYYYRLLPLAAKHHLMIDIHGAFAPTGLLRTFPNYVTQEGVMGAEYNKWSHRITATHNVTLPFTRMILGPMDYTPGGFHNATPATFEARNHLPEVQTTRGQAVAMYVVYDSPLMMIADAPSAYKNADGSWADGADIIRMIPATWDETRVLQGDIGQYIVTARRTGDKWYIGAMTNEAGRTVTIPLDFLKAGETYMSMTYQDGADVTHLTRTGKTVHTGDSLTLKLAPSGGGVVYIEPAHVMGATTKPPKKTK